MVFGRSRFGQIDSTAIPQIGTLAKNGKNFPDGEGFKIPNSFSNDLENKWGAGNATAAGMVGRELGPGNSKLISNSEYFHKPGMVRPGGPEDAYGFALNNTCNVLKSDSRNSVGMFYNDPSRPRLVSMNNFGKNRFGKNKFGNNNLYSQMGPAYGNSYLMKDTTVADLYGGAIQKPYGRPTSVQSKNTFIGQYDNYVPIKYNNIGLTNFGSSKKKSNFGKRDKDCGCSGFGKKKSKRSKKIGEGNTLSIGKNGKIKVT
jgi:hypothetical protein